MCSLAPSANHIAIEPIPGLAAELSKNFPKTTVINAALADYSGRSSFKYVQNHDALSGLRERHYDVDDVRIIEIPVEVLPLDALSAGAGRYGFIKIDCEGGEYHVLKGARETILRDRPVIVFEAGANSTGTYGVTASMLYSLLCDDYQMKLSTMQRWLSQGQDFTREEFINNWGTSSGDYYFIAHP
jgi:FkbM family methyltransferase